MAEGEDRLLINFGFQNTGAQCVSVPLRRTVFHQGLPRHHPAAQELPTAKQPRGLHSPNLLFLPVHSKTFLGNCPFVLHLAKSFLVLKYNFNKLNTQLHLLAN